MATIEERANKNGLAYQFCKESIEADHKIFEKGYIKGATEQKAIDIDKACEWLENWAKAIESYTIGESIEMLRKALEI